MQLARLRMASDAFLPRPAAQPVLFNQPGPLPPLQSTEARTCYRQRSQDDVEEVTWVLPDSEDQQLSEPTKLRLSSLHSRRSSVIKFSNKSSRPVRALWLDFDGNEIAYSTIEPGITTLYGTYASHPWIVRELSTGARMMLSGAAAVIGMELEQVVDIADPPVLNWTLESHCCFPQDFRVAVRALLLAHQRLATVGSAWRQVTSTTPPCTPLQWPNASPSASSAFASAAASFTTAQGPLSPTAQLTHPTGMDRLLPDVADAPSGPDTQLQQSTPLSPCAIVHAAGSTSGCASGGDGQRISPDAFVSSGADQGSPATLQIPQSPATRGRLALISGLKSSLSTLKGLVSPGRARTARQAAASPSQPGPDDREGLLFSPFEAALQLECPEADEDGPRTNLGCLPQHLLLHIIKLAAPVQWQGTHMPLVGRPDIKPALLSAPPEDNTNNNAEADGAQHPLQQQDQQPVQDDQQQVEQQEGGDVAAAGVDAAPGWFQAFIPLGPLGLGAAGLLVDGDVFGDMPGMAEAPSDDDNDDDNDDE